jgi:hypothetical protein
LTVIVSAFDGVPPEIRPVRLHCAIRHGFPARGWKGWMT